MNTITFRTAAQASMFKHELKGQFSDGMWENTRPDDHWKFWCNLVVQVQSPHSAPIGVQSMEWCVKKNYGINRKELLECVGDRMMSQAIMARWYNLVPVRTVAEILEGCFTWNGTSIVFTEMDILGTINKKIHTYEGYAKSNQGTATETWWNERVEQLNAVRELIRTHYQGLLNCIENYTYKNMLSDLKEIKSVMKTARGGY